ncbi:shikimate kinase [Lishizhenia tianjinensis]|uniref:Shikimate kinase n=1 Tax=Lishizhenia tianjinensis TaxID=477690 RepID=A0A1I6YKP5_9FLAO|nr:shikimate kinase [Lishizhenia tianjinensis]SFT50992.1 shikimate kinase [Lishizhenia tianjinensis]
MVEQNVILIGFMGVGKTSLGKKLARKLELDFVDTDEIIEQREGKTISVIFEQQGEGYFRNLELNLIDELLKEKGKSESKVISVGGGLPIYNGLSDKLNALGVTIYLQRPAKELFNRLVNAKEQRPLVKKLKEDELLSYIENTLEIREPVYKQAHFVLDRTQQEVNTILKILEEA